MRRRTWSVACALVLGLTGIPAVTAAAAPSVDDVVVRGTLVATLGSGRDASGTPVETVGLGVRTSAGAVVRLDVGSADEVLGGARSGDTVEVVVDPASAGAVAALRAPGVKGTVDVGGLTARSVTVVGAAQVAAAPARAVHSAYVVRIDDATATGEFTAAEGRGAVAAGSAYWKTETGSVVNGITVRGEQTLATSNVCAELRAGDYDAVWERAQARFPGLVVSPKNRKHLVVMVPRSCYTDGWISWVGLATIGTGLASGGYVLLAADDAHTVAHELGHNFGLGHSDLLTPSGITEYLGIHSVMGASFSDGATTFAPPALDPAFREVLGIQAASEVTAGKPGVETRLSAVGKGAGRSLRFSDEEGNLVYVELRDGAGRDARAFYASPGATGPDHDHGTGVRFSTLLADEHGTPGLLTYGGVFDGGGTWSVLRAGETVRVSAANRDVTVRSISGGTARLVFSGAARSTTKLSRPSVRYGRTTKVSVKVTGASVPQGVVQFYVGSKRVASAKVKADGRATATLPASVKPGSRVVKARYVGDVMLAVSTSKHTVTVAKGRPSIKVTKATKVRKGARATFTVRLGSVAGTSPRGTVRAKVGSTYVSSAVAVKRSGTSWVAKVRTGTLPRGKVKLVYTPARSVSKLLTTTTVSSGRTAR